MTAADIASLVLAALVLAVTGACVLYRRKESDDD